MSEADELEERRVAEKVMDLLRVEGMTLETSIQKVPMRMPDGNVLWADKVQIEIKKKKSEIIIPGVDAATKKVAMELMSGGKK